MKLASPIFGTLQKRAYFICFTIFTNKCGEKNIVLYPHFKSGIPPLPLASLIYKAIVAAEYQWYEFEFVEGEHLQNLILTPLIIFNFQTCNQTAFNTKTFYI